MRRANLRLLVLAATLVAMLAVGVVALAEKDGSADGAFGQAGGYVAAGPGIPGGTGPGQVRTMMQVYGGPPAIAAADGFVFVVQGTTLYKFNAATLEEAGRADLGVQDGPMPMGMPGGPRGGFGGGNAGGGGGGRYGGGNAGGGYGGGNAGGGSGGGGYGGGPVPR